MGKVAFITGGNGITGSAILEYLVMNTTPTQWSKIIVTSRRSFRSPVKDPRITFVALDFSKSPQELIRQMRDICHNVTNAYFSSYIHRPDFAELRAANQGLFENFLTALTTVASSTLQNVTLQTGGKYYNVHLHPVPIPVSESHPRDTSALTDNFYYAQEDHLAAQQRGHRWSYNIIRPQAIIGATTSPNGMSEALNFALYFLVCRELGTDAPMPTNQAFWEGVEDCAYAPLLADLTVYVSTTPRCANEAFNMANGDAIVWKYLWPRLAAYFGVTTYSDQVFTLPRPNPGERQLNFSLAEWAADRREVWERLCEKEGARGAMETFGHGTWDFQEWATGRSWSTMLSIEKARQYGWEGHIDSYRAFVNAFGRLEETGIIPRVRVDGGPGLPIRMTERQDDLQTDGTM